MSAKGPYQAVLAIHSKCFLSTSDEVYGTNPRCAECQSAFPCNTRVLLASHGITEDKGRFVPSTNKAQEGR